MKNKYLKLLSLFLALSGTVFGKFVPWKNVENNKTIFAMTMDKKGTMCATATRDGNVIIRDTYSGKEIKKINVSNTVTPYHIKQIEFSPDGNFLIVASSEHAATIWNVKTGNLHLTLAKHIDEVSFATFSGDGSKIATSSLDGSTIVSDAKNGKVLNVFMHSDLPINYASIDNSGNKLITASYDGRIVVWDIASGEPMSSISYEQLQDSDSIKSVSFNSDGTKIIIAIGETSDSKFSTPYYLNNTVNVFDLNTKKKVLSFKHDSFLESAFFSVNDTTIVTTTYDSINIINPETGEVLQSIKNYTDLPAVISGDGTKIAATSRNDSVSIWVSQINKDCK